MNFLDQLKVLCAIVDGGSFSCASRLLHRSQPALSVAIKKLEERLGFQLFDRSGYRPCLTENGVEIYNRAKQLLLDSNDLLEYSHYLAKGCEPKVSLTISFSGSMDKVLPAMQRVQQEAKETCISLNVRHPFRAIMDVLNDNTDICLAFLQPDQGSLEQCPLFSFQFVPVYSPQIYTNYSVDHPSDREVTNFPHANIAITDLPIKCSYFDHCGDTQWIVDDLTALKKIVCSGFAWGWVPEHTIKRELASGELVEIATDDISRVDVVVALIHLKAKRLGIVGQKLKKEILSSNWTV